jgi:hypothetical protein
MEEGGRRGSIEGRKINDEPNTTTRKGAAQRDDDEGDATWRR